jgi:hypothetical protein
MKYLDEILEFWLPNKLSRLIAGMSITLGVGAYFLPEILTSLNIKMLDHLILLIRIAMPLLIWLVGSLSVLHIIVQYCKTLKGQSHLLSAVPKSKTKLTKLQKAILLHIHKHIGDSLTFQIVQTFNLSEDIARYHLDELCKNEFIRKRFPVLPDQDTWCIDDKGTKYLIENKLIS